MTTSILEHRVLKAAVLSLMAADVVLIALHVFWGGDAVHLDAEGNITTWFSSTKLMFISAFCVAIAFEERALVKPIDAENKRSGFGFFAFGMLFAALSLDETASLHERLARALVEQNAGDVVRSVMGGDVQKASYTWVLWAAPIAILVFTAMAAFAWQRRAQLQKLWIFGLGGAWCYASAMILEPLGVIGTPRLSSWNQEQVDHYLKLLIFEEAAEMVGTDFF
ncbi:MAG: hypothetical protein GY822_20205 [Deltaproteobacteria bacterium]|nr:hypothetical protein [Deltaproteobacteria bacterium]